MTPRPLIHPTPAVLGNFCAGDLAAPEAATVASHLESCEACRRTVEEVSGRARTGRGPHAVPAASVDGAAGDAVAGLPPELLDHPRFCVVRRLGEGGMGAVYLAEHRLMERRVAIKVINPALLDRPDTLPRFLGEIKAAARLNHENIVQAHDAEQAGGLHMLVMEYVDGLSLDRVLRQKGPLPVAHACYYIRQAALGLQYAFERGMTHRDIKPHNLMLTRQGKIKILDFGLARVRSERAGERGLTAEGAFLGTPDYVAPEQATDARQADIRADIYSLGCTLYALLTGRPPFREETIVKLVLAHLGTEPRPVHELRPEVPTDLSATIARMLAKEPSQRYQTPLEVAQALSPFCKPRQKAVAPQASAAPGTALPNRGTLMADPRDAMPRAIGRAVTALGPASAPGRPTPQHGPEAQGPRRRLAGRHWTLVGAAALLITIAMASVIYVSTNKGTIKLELSDPKADVQLTVDHDTVHVSGLGEPLRLKVGDHSLIVSGKNFETITRSFTVKRGDNPVLRIMLPEPPKMAANKSASEGGVSPTPKATAPVPEHSGPKRNDERRAVTNRPAEKPPAKETSLPRNRWIALDPAEGQIHWIGRAENGVLILNPPRGKGTGVDYPRIRGRNMTIRAQLKQPQWDRTTTASLSLRWDPRTNTSYSASLCKFQNRRGYQFNIEKHFGPGARPSWTALKHSAVRPVADLDVDDFFEFAFSAVGDKLWITVNGKRVVEARDPDFEEGTIALGAWQCRALFKDIEVKILDD